LISALLIFDFSFWLYIASKNRAAIKDWEAVDLKITVAIVGATTGVGYCACYFRSSLCAVSTLLQLEYNSFYGYQRV